MVLAEVMVLAYYLIRMKWMDRQDEKAMQEVYEQNADEIGKMK